MKTQACRYGARRAWTAEVLGRLRFVHSMQSAEIALEIEGFEAEFGKLSLVNAPRATDAAMRDARDIMLAIQRAILYAKSHKPRARKPAKSRARR